LDAVRARLWCGWVGWLEFEFVEVEREADFRGSGGTSSGV
jgi:hypothetical protein